MTLLPDLDSETSTTFLWTWSTGLDVQDSPLPYGKAIWFTGGNRCMWQDTGVSDPHRVRRIGVRLTINTGFISAFHGKPSVEKGASSPPMTLLLNVPLRYSKPPGFQIRRSLFIERLTRSSLMLLQITTACWITFHCKVP